MIDIFFLLDMGCHAPKTLRFWSCTWNGRWMRTIYLAISCTVCSLMLLATIMANTLHLLSLTTTGIESWPCKQHLFFENVCAFPVCVVPVNKALFRLICVAVFQQL